jgi:hypothetical protein
MMESALDAGARLMPQTLVRCNGHDSASGGPGVITCCRVRLSPGRLDGIGASLGGHEPACQYDE